MCGIFGSFEYALEPSDLEKAIAALQPRGPDDWGIWHSSTSGVGGGIHSSMRRMGPWTVADLSNEGLRGIDLGTEILAHTRLAIQDLSLNGHQPMSFNGKHLVFNGEIYNFIEIRAELEAEGWTFIGTSDSEVLLKSFVQWGERCLEKIVGAYAFAVWDEMAKVLFAARDRMGKKPLYLSRAGRGGMIFASEIKAIVAARACAVVPNKSVSVRYAVLADLPRESETFFDGIYQLPAATYLIWRPGMPEPRFQRYWYPNGDRQRPGNEVWKDIQALLNDSVALRLRADTPVGVCLSGGIDSGCVLFACSEMEAQRRTAIHTLSAIQSTHEYNELHRVNSIIEAAGVKNCQMFQTYDEVTYDLFLDFIRANDEPLRYSGTFNQFRFMKAVRDSGFKVVLSGQGADELFIGYPWYIKSYILNCLHTKNHEHASFWLSELAARTGIAAEDIRSDLEAEISLTSYISRRRLESEAWMAPEIWDTFCRDTVVGEYELQTDWKRFHADEVMNLRLPGLLKDEDRNSSAHGVETRLPYLDHRLVELALSLRPHDCMRDGHTKWPLRRLLNCNLPDDYAWAKAKVGFYVPFTLSSIEYRAHLPEVLSDADWLGEFFDRNALLDKLRGATIDPQFGWRAYNLALAVHNASLLAQ